MRIASAPIRYPIAATLLLAGVLSAAAYRFQSRRLHRSTPGPSAQSRYWLRKTYVDSAYAAVLMGDSRTYNALAPEVLAPIAPGGGILNFGYPDGGFNPLMFRAAERKFAPGCRRRILVLGVTPNAMTPKKGALNLRYKEQLAQRADVVFAHLRLGPLMRFFESMAPAEVLDALCASGRTVERAYGDDGWMPESWSPANPRQQLPVFAEKFRGNPVDPALVDGLVAQVGDWTAAGYVVVGYRPPTTPAMRALEDSLSGFDYAGFASRFRAAGGRWIPCDERGLASFDGSHLDRESALAFSRAMRDSILGILAATPARASEESDP